MAFLADLWLGLARQRLQRSKGVISRIAAEGGYQLEARFSRAMLRRRYGIGPRALRPAGEAGAGAGTRPDKG